MSLLNCPLFFYLKVSWRAGESIFRSRLMLPRDSLALASACPLELTLSNGRPKVKHGKLFNRPGVAGAFLQTPPSLTDWVSDPFPSNLQNTITPKPLELGTWNFYTLFTTCHVSCVTCHLSHVTCHDTWYVTCHIKLVFFLIPHTGDTNSLDRCG